MPVVLLLAIGSCRHIYMCASEGQFNWKSITCDIYYKTCINQREYERYSLGFFPWRSAKMRNICKQMVFRIQMDLGITMMDQKRFFHWHGKDNPLFSGCRGRKRKQDFFLERNPILALSVINLPSSLFNEWFLRCCVHAEWNGGSEVGVAPSSGSLQHNPSKAQRRQW